MIDDFVVRPQSGRFHHRPRKQETEEDFFPDLSTHITHRADTKPEPTEEPKQEEFLTPQEAAEQDERIEETIEMDDTGAEDSGDESVEPAPIPSSSNEPPERPPKERWWTRLRNWFNGLSKKQKTFFITATILIVAGAGYATYALFFAEKPQAPQTVARKKPKPKPTTVASNLTGLQVAPEINQRTVLGAIIENSVDARPQAGLSDAGVVIEAIAEGGITRFLALYQDTEPESIGPIRSMRPYFLDWGLSFDAAFAHVGGSPESLQRIQAEGIADLDQSFNANHYQRVSNRYAPHNVFSSVGKLNELSRSKNYGASEFTSFKRKKEKVSAQPNAQTINLNISSQRFNVMYSYDMESNTYARSMNGVAHVDVNNNKQITPKVVIAMVMNYGIASDGKHSVYNTIGNGKVYVFQDGSVTEGTWEKANAQAQITFKDAAGEVIALNPGQTWITAVNNPGSVRYQP